MIPSMRPRGRPLDDLGGFPSCLVPDSGVGVGEGSSGGVEPGGGRGPCCGPTPTLQRAQAAPGRHQRQPDHDEPVVIPLDVLVEY